MLSELYRRHGYPTSPSSAVTTRLTAFLNECQQELLSEPGLRTWLARHEPPLTFASVASRATYGVPTPSIDAIVDRTNLVRLEARSLDWYRSVEPDPTTRT